MAAHASATGSIISFKEKLPCCIVDPAQAARIDDCDRQWDRTTPEDVLCWRRGNYTPALNLVVNNIAARNVRTNLGCPQRQLMHGCATRTYAALLDDHLALLEAAEALAPRGARR